MTTLSTSRSSSTVGVSRHGELRFARRHRPRPANSSTRREERCRGASLPAHRRRRPQSDTCVRRDSPAVDIVHGHSTQLLPHSMNPEGLLPYNHGSPTTVLQVLPWYVTCTLSIIRVMIRENEIEILDQNDVPEELVARAYRDLARIHRWLGDTNLIVRAIREDPQPVHRILDVGCATGLVLEEVGRRLGVEVVGVDINPHPGIAASVPIIQADALHDPLPFADVAYAMHLGHHLCERDLVRLIRNVGRYCRRFILLDLVRHPLPLALFRVFIAPLVCPIDAEDGQRSVRRSYTPSEFRRITASALAGGAGSFRLSVAPFYIRQVIDISYANAGRYPGSNVSRPKDSQRRGRREARRKGELSAVHASNSKL